jgi:hypothetical protein
MSKHFKWKIFQTFKQFRHKDADGALEAVLASSDAIDDASLSIDLTIESLLSEREEFFIFSFKDAVSMLFLAFFSLGCTGTKGCTTSCCWIGC